MKKGRRNFLRSSLTAAGAAAAASLASPAVKAAESLHSASFSRPNGTTSRAPITRSRVNVG